MDNMMHNPKHDVIYPANPDQPTDPQDPNYPATAKKQMRSFSVRISVLNITAMYDEKLAVPILTISNGEETILLGMWQWQYAPIRDEPHWQFALINNIELNKETMRWVNFVVTTMDQALEQENLNPFTELKIMR